MAHNSISRLIVCSTQRSMLMWFLGLCFFLIVDPCVARDAEFQKFGEEVETQLREQHFDELEHMAQRFRQSDARFVGGNAKLFNFYRALGDFSGQAREFESEIPFLEKRHLLEAWIAAAPTSIASRLGIAELWRNYAWRARGTAYAKDVTNEQWAGFFEGFNKLESYMQGVDPNSDPAAFFMLLDLARARGGPRETLDALYRAAVRRYPTYFHFYGPRARNLELKWFGEEGELASYVQSLLISPGGEEGQVAYTYVASAIRVDFKRDDIYRNTGLSWPAVKAAYAARERRYGLRKYDWNMVCYLAVAATDRQTARNALEQIGEDWDQEIWRERKHFDQIVAWIRRDS
jgi:hypothetical protein